MVIIYNNLKILWHENGEKTDVKFMAGKQFVNFLNVKTENQKQHLDSELGCHMIQTSHGNARWSDFFFGTADYQKKIN